MATVGTVTDCQAGVPSGHTGNGLVRVCPHAGMPSGETGDGTPAARDDAAPDAARSDGTAGSAGFDWRGWTLVGAVLIAFFVVPLAILYLPAARGLIRSIGLTVRDGYLVLPLLPAFGLGALAVWSAVRSRSD